MNTKTKGDIAVAHAIAKMTDQGHEVLIPLGDKKPYDLVIDNGLELMKVQVKYAGTDEKGHSIAWLRTVGGNRSCQTTKKYSNDDFEILFVYTDEGRTFMIPWDVLTNRVSVRVNADKFARYEC